MAKRGDEIFGETLRAFRKRHIEPGWEELDAPSAARYESLFSELNELGVTALALGEDQGGLALGPGDQLAIVRELGAALPALAFGLVSHVTALDLVLEACGDEKNALVEELLQGARLALAGSPLDRTPDAHFELASNGRLSLRGSQRLPLAYPDHLVVPARDGASLRLCVVPFDQEGVRFRSGASSHGLCLVPVGALELDVVLRREQVFPWPASGRAAQKADGLVTALLAGMIGEMADRAMSYALERYQGGKMIHEHDAVRLLVGPIQLSRRVAEALASSTLSETRPGDGGAAAFAIELAREAGLDAVQTFGGNGYMADYRVERYLRDANTLETAWVHSAARKREIARLRFEEMAR